MSLCLTVVPDCRGHHFGCRVRHGLSRVVVFAILRVALLNLSLIPNSMNQFFLGVGAGVLVEPGIALVFPSVNRLFHGAIDAGVFLLVLPVDLVAEIGRAHV